MSRIEHSKIAISHIRLFLPDIMDQLTAILMPQAREKGVALSVRSENISHSAFYGDSPRINQILINLLGNAVKFTPAGGKVDSEAEDVQMALESGMTAHVAKPIDMDVLQSAPEKGFV